MSMTMKRAIVGLLTVTMLALGCAAVLPGNAGVLNTAAAQAEDNTQADTQDQLTAWNFRNADVVRLYARDIQDNAYVPVTDSNVAGDIVNLIRKAGQGEAGEMFSRTDGAFFMELSDGSKYNYTLVYSALRVGTVAYPLTQEEYTEMQSLYNTVLSSGAGSYVQWLSYMTPSRVSSISYYSMSSVAAREIPTANVLEAATILSNVRIKKGSGSTFSEEMAFTPGPGKVIIDMHFSAGITYSIMIDSSNKMYIKSSDMTYGCAYELDNAVVTNLINKLDAYFPNLW